MCVCVCSCLSQIAFYCFFFVLAHFLARIKNRKKAPRSNRVCVWGKGRRRRGVHMAMVCGAVFINVICCFFSFFLTDLFYVDCSFYLLLGKCI